VAQATANNPATEAPSADNPTVAAPTRTDFHVRYISESNVYIDGGRNAGLAEGTKLVLKQDTGKSELDKTNTALEPGIIAKLTVVSVASTSAVCEVNATTRDIAVDDVLSMPDAEVEKLVEKNTLGNTRKYPMVISFSEGDPLDEEVRDSIPRPPLPEVNQVRGRVGFDMSQISQLGQGSSTSTEYGMVVRADITRMFGSHWNLNGYWRGNIAKGSTPSQPTLQDTINRTYLMSLTYINSASNWTAGIGRLYLPWASSLETIDGGYVARKISSNSIGGVFFGTTPDPSSWSYNPNGEIGGTFVNIHGGSYDALHLSSTAGFGVNLVNWSINRPFLFTENEFSFKRYFSIFHSMQVDRPTANPSTPAIGLGLGQSLLTVRVQVHPRVTLDLTDTYFRDVPTYDPTLLGTGLLDKYLFQGLNGGARIQFPVHITGYFSIGQSSDSSDPKSSLNSLFGISMANIAKTGIEADVRYSKFDSAFAAGNYRSISVTRDLGERFRLSLEGGSYAYNSSVAAQSSSYYINVLSDTNLGAKYFIENAFTTQRGGSIGYNQWTTTVGYRFNNRASARRSAIANKP
jgi:hypothetical protein